MINRKRFGREDLLNLFFLLLTLLLQPRYNRNMYACNICEMSGVMSLFTLVLKFKLSIVLFLSLIHILQVTSFTHKSRKDSSYKCKVGKIAPNRINRRLNTSVPHQKITTNIGEMVDLVRSVSDTPCAVGFGISTPEQAKHMSQYADGVIVGSAIVKIDVYKRQELLLHIQLPIRLIVHR